MGMRFALKALALTARRRLARTMGCAPSGAATAAHCRWRSHPSPAGSPASAGIAASPPAAAAAHQRVAELLLHPRHHLLRHRLLLSAHQHLHQELLLLRCQVLPHQRAPRSEMVTSVRSGSLLPPISTSTVGVRLRICAAIIGLVPVTSTSKVIENPLQTGMPPPLSMV